MSSIGFPLNMPYYLLISLYKMGKRFRKQRSNSSLFHHGLITIILMHKLKLKNDCWYSFITRHGFGNPELGEVYKLVIEETLVNPTTYPPPLQAFYFPPNSEPLSYPKVIQQDSRSVTHPKDCIKTVKKPTGKKLKGSVDVNFKNKRVGRLISQSIRNKTNPCEETISMIEMSERSDSEIDKFLVEEDHVSFGLYPDRPYDYVNNLPPCVKDNPEFLGIQLCDKYTICIEDSPTHNVVRANANSLQS
jgi:hypothetical protein